MVRSAQYMILLRDAFSTASVVISEKRLTKGSLGSLLGCGIRRIPPCLVRLRVIPSHPSPIFLSSGIVAASKVSIYRRDYIVIVEAR